MLIELPIRQAINVNTMVSGVNPIAPNVMPTKPVKISTRTTKTKITKNT
jgi:hypothetical protein